MEAEEQELHVSALDSLDEMSEEGSDSEHSTHLGYTVISCLRFAPQC